MIVYLIRHGKTEGNMKRQYVGSTDQPLCDEGVRHAHASGIDTGITHVYVSPYQRARETARIKFPNARQTVIPDLREIDFGDFECRTHDEMSSDETYLRWVESNWGLTPPNGEPLKDFSARVQGAFEALIRDGLTLDEKALYIVAHGGTIMTTLHRYGVPYREYPDWYLDNCEGYRVFADGETWETAPALTDILHFKTYPSKET